MKKDRLVKQISFVFLFFFMLVSTIKAELIKIPFSKITPKHIVTLKYAKSKFTVKVPIPERWKVKKAILKLNFENSAVLSERSVLILKINGYILDQIKLSSFSPKREIDIPIPGSVFFNGYNELSFNVIQHYKTDKLCEDPFAPELWTTLYLKNSYLIIDYSLKSIPLKLSSIIGFLCDPKLLPYGKVNLVLEKINPEFLESAGIVASGISLRFDYRDVIFNVSEKLEPGMDNFIIGTRDFVRKILSKYKLKFKITGPYLKIFYYPFIKIDETTKEKKIKYDKRHALFIVSGKDIKEVKTAAKVFASISFPFPDSSSMTIKSLNIPKPIPYTGKSIIKDGAKYSFKELGFFTTTFRLGSPSKSISFYIPSDLLIKPNRYVDLYLTFSYGSGARKDSSLNILLNKTHVISIPLDNPKGALYEDYKISIPAYMFKRGYNIITFEPVLTPKITNLCEFIQTKNLFLTIFEKSSIYFPKMTHLVDLPRIDLFFQDGFPITRIPDGSNSLIYITKFNPMTASVFLNLIGLVTKKIKYPLFGINVVDKLSEKKSLEKEIIVIGPYKSIPIDLIKRCPLQLLAENKVSYPLLKLKGKILKSKIEKLIDELFNKKEKSPTDLYVLTKQISKLLDKGLIMEFESPYKRGKSVLVFTANTSWELETLMEIIKDPSVQVKCGGDLTLVELDPPYKTYSLKIGHTYYTEKYGEISIVNYYLRKYFYIFVGSIILVILILSLLTYIWIRRYRRKRLDNVEEYVEE